MSSFLSRLIYGGETSTDVDDDGVTAAPPHQQHDTTVEVEPVAAATADEFEEDDIELEPIKIGKGFPAPVEEFNAVMIEAANSADHKSIIALESRKVMISVLKSSNQTDYNLKHPPSMKQLKRGHRVATTDDGAEAVECGLIFTGYGKKKLHLLVPVWQEYHVLLSNTWRTERFSSKDQAIKYLSKRYHMPAKFVVEAYVRYPPPPIPRQLLELPAAPLYAKRPALLGQDQDPNIPPQVAHDQQIAMGFFQASDRLVPSTNGNTYSYAPVHYENYHAAPPPLDTEKLIGSLAKFMNAGNNSNGPAPAAVGTDASAPRDSSNSMSDADREVIAVSVSKKIEPMLDRQTHKMTTTVQKQQKSPASAQNARSAAFDAGTHAAAPTNANAFDGPLRKRSGSFSGTDETESPIRLFKVEPATGNEDEKEGAAVAPNGDHPAVQETQLLQLKFAEREIFFDAHGEAFACLDQENKKLDAAITAKDEAGQQAAYQSMFVFPKLTRKLYQYRNQFYKIREEGMEFPPTIETDNVAAWISASLMGQGVDGASRLGNRVIFGSNFCMLFTYNPLDNDFDEMADNEDVLSSYMPSVLDYGITNTITMVYKDEDGDELDIVLSIASREFGHSFTAFSAAFVAVVGAAENLRVTAIDLESQVAEGTAPIPLTVEATSVLERTSAEFTLKFTKANITQGQQRALASSKRPLKFETCSFDMDGRGYPLLTEGDNPLSLCFHEEVPPFSDLEEAVKKNKILSPLRLIAHVYKFPSEKELPQQLYVGQEFRLRDLYKIARKHGVELIIESCGHPKMGARVCESTWKAIGTTT